jgi:RNA polymerase sigma-70 factor (ECF subfamily)
MSAGEIEDAMQEIELRALRQPPRGERRVAWACAVATNLAMDSHRRARRSDGRSIPDEPSPVVEAGERVELREAVRAGLRRLDPELRATVVLRFYADLSIPQVALAMTVPEGTVKSRLHRAISELRAVLPRESLR